MHSPRPRTLRGWRLTVKTIIENYIGRLMITKILQMVIEEVSSMVKMKDRCNFCDGVGKISHVSKNGTRTEICFICRGRGFTMTTIHSHVVIPSCAAETTA
jgi:hypothetical protein